MVFVKRLRELDLTETVYQYSYSFVINKYAMASLYVNKSQANVPVISQFSVLKSAMSYLKPLYDTCLMFENNSFVGN